MYVDIATMMPGEPPNCQSCLSHYHHTPQIITIKVNFEMIFIYISLGK